ncbi:PilZ domain-containing protein [Sphingomonas rubra]|uniref:PilZ domain-containing protein n=1 Tax=Sphingomonas rubra TaxID=634430 RepID=A0A1I5RX38_9SPHN|nr:PilZ domain-containing protein [Sphingomonas rubra]SFP63053.1 PilZ domain-containing protein [Sphingomonas rubra]
MNGLAPTLSDERGEQRVEVLLRTRATCEDGLACVVTVVNLSQGGLMARCDAGLAAEQTLLVELPTLGRVAVEVRWSLGGRIGCRFVHPLSPDRYDALLAAITRN